MQATEYARSEPRVVVVGSNAFERELIITYLQDRAELVCSSCSPPDLTELLRDEACHEALFLIDAQNADLHALLRVFAMEAQGNGHVLCVAAYNIDPDLGMDLEALDRGLQGVFYTTDPAGNVAKGVEAMLSGEKWFPRKTLYKYLREQRIGAELRGEASGELTAREKEVLLGVSAGASNQELADELRISFHTVKTHLYNIYRKLGVNSRHQATQWASRHLEPAHSGFSQRG